MKRNLPPLPWLRAFEASARHLSFTNAADELGLTQAAISKQVKNLELRLKEPLFVRLPRSVRLTRIGEAYLPKVRDAFERLSAGTDEVFGQRPKDILTIRGAVGFTANWLMPRLPDFQHRYPACQFRIISSLWNEELDDTSYDLDIRYGTGPWAGYESRRLVNEKIFPLCSPRLKDGDKPLASAEALKDHCLLHVLGYQDGWANWLSAAGLTDMPPNRDLYFDTSILSFQAAMGEMGIALARTSMAQLPLLRGDLIKPFELEVSIEESFHVLKPRDVRLHPQTTQFLDWLLEQAEADQTKPDRKTTHD